MNSNSEEKEVGLKGWLSVIGSAIGAFMAVLDIQITSSSLKDIQGSLGASIDEGSWISTAYLIAEIVTIPLTGWLSQVVGLKRYVVTNAILFVIFSMFCGAAVDLNSMILFRAAQGFTGGTLIPTAFAIILSTLPKSKQPIGLAIFSITAVFAPAIGPAVGGYITEAMGWQYSFYLNLLPGLLLIAILLYSLPAASAQWQLLRKGDYAGIVSMALGLGGLTYVLEEGQRKDWFGSEHIVVAAIISVVSLSIFLLIELTCKNPLINLKLLLRRNFGLGSLANTVLGAAMYGSVYLLPLYLSIVQKYSAWQIGQVMIWSGLPQLFVIPLIPKLMKVLDPRLMVAIGLAAFSGSCFLNSFMSVDYSGPQFTISLLLRAVGQPFIMVPLSSLTTAGLEVEQAGSASSLYNMMRNLGGSIGISAMATLLARREQFHSFRLSENITATDMASQSFLADSARMLQASGMPAVQSKTAALQLLQNHVRQESFVMAFNDCYLLVATMLFCAIGVVFLLKKPNDVASKGQTDHSRNGETPEQELSSAHP